MQSPALSQGESTAPPTPLPTPTEIEAPKPPIIARPMPSRAATDQPTSKHRTKSASRCQARKLASGNPGVSHPCPSPAIPLTSPSTIPRPFFSEDHTARAASLADYVTISRYPSSRVWTGVAPLIGPSSEMKQSWFSNLFSWTPAVNSTPLLFEFADDRTRCSLRSPPTTAPPPERNASAPRNLRDERSP